MATNEETNAAGTDTRPPMLVENDYESWKIRIHRYIRGKPNGKLIWKSIQNGPTPHPMVTDPPPANSTVMPAPRKKLDSEFNDEENKLEMADTQAEIILSQGLPRHIFNILNQTSTAKEIWDNVEMLMQGSGRTLQQRKEDLFKMEISQPHLIVQITTHLNAYEPHAKRLSRTQEQSTCFVDPWPMFAHTNLHLAFIANLLSGFQKQFPPTNNHSGLPPTQGLMLRCMMVPNCYELIQRKAPGNVGNKVLEQDRDMFHRRGERTCCEVCNRTNEKDGLTKYFKEFKALLMGSYKRKEMCLMVK
ncbi:hypothetical protein Tco_0360278 [Tanacetum coccineum]